MLCAVYKSAKKADTYLYIPRKDDFSQVPEDLMAIFGRPVFVMPLLLKPERKLARLSIEELTAAFDDKGYYLQLPPPPEDLLKAHKAGQGAA
ncbi:YcgL domain-containing protein [Gallaecimonas kandeliae]|uniref:YcgL domain-containing protein n=1 Tax=Gallaecimonas kandeliae TaxID=3029055 RepID=UPI002649E7F8|nr:YcgL domain-containing protein [Gallaecimonas kandeliae]WKE64402.1 YcgL domain-containing protein [Gallaecimonas kandeliae]